MRPNKEPFTPSGRLWRCARPPKLGNVYLADKSTAFSQFAHITEKPATASYISSAAETAESSPLEKATTFAVIRNLIEAAEVAVAESNITISTAVEAKEEQRVAKKQIKCW